MGTVPWYTIANIDDFDSPCLVIYKQRAAANIDRVIQRVKDVKRLRPHVKTNKIAEVCSMMLERGITKFKCATIAEAEMLAMIGAPDVLFAYQPVGPKALRFFELVKKYAGTSFSCLVDNTRTAGDISSLFEKGGLKARVFVDLNTGMNRTGAGEGNMIALIDLVRNLPGLALAGIHAYDGHVKESDSALRQKSSDSSFAVVSRIIAHAERNTTEKLTIIAGGSPSFATHLERDVECSPGTFVFWDWGYHRSYEDEPYEFAALVVTRVTSVVNDHTVTTDLGYKAVASENPLPRVHFLNAPGVRQVTQSEEHLTLHVDDSSQFPPGTVLYGVPFHICPTVALYDFANVVENHTIVGEWKVTARGRRIRI